MACQVVVVEMILLVQWWLPLIRWGREERREKREEREEGRAKMYIAFEVTSNYKRYLVAPF